MFKKAPHQKKNRGKLFIFLTFLALVGLLIYPTFVGPLPFTGSAIASPNTAQVSSDVTDASTKLDGSFSKLELKGSSTGNLFVGSGKYNLEPLDDITIILKDYEGKIYFTEHDLVLLDGKASSVSLNGIPISSQSGKAISVSLSDTFKYRTLKINDIFSSTFSS